MGKHIHRSSVIAAASILALVGTATQAVPASAAGDCAADRLRLFIDNDYQGGDMTVGAVSAGEDTGESDYGGAHLPASINDNISSIKNSAKKKICFYEHVNFNGSVVHLRPASNSLNLQTCDFDNKIFSFRQC